MSETRARLFSEMKETLKSGQKERLGVIRLLITEVKNAEINDLQAPGRERTEEEAISIIAAYHKSLTKTMAEYPENRREPLRAELAIIEDYLPKQMSPEEVKAWILAEIANTPERNFSLLMRQIQPKLVGRTDGKTVSESLKAVLASV